MKEHLNRCWKSLETTDRTPQPPPSLNMDYFWQLTCSLWSLLHLTLALFVAQISILTSCPCFLILRNSWASFASRLQERRFDFIVIQHFLLLIQIGLLLSSFCSKYFFAKCCYDSFQNQFNWNYSRPNFHCLIDLCVSVFKSLILTCLLISA